MDPEINMQIILEIMINAVMKNEYDAITRTLLLRMCGHFQIPISSFLSYEKKLLQCLHLLLSSLSQSKDGIKEDAKKTNV